MAQKSKRKLAGISLSDKILGILVIVFGSGIVGILSWVVSALWSLEHRVSGLETRVEDLREIVMSKVATQTITVTYTATGVTPPPSPVPGYPFESIMVGLLFGLLVVLLIHRSRRYLIS